MLRNIILIDEEKCNGCGDCIPGCPEGALQIIDGKARLVSDLMCDGLGACLGHCPEGAITVVEREAEPYDERKVMAQIVPQGAGTIRAHLEHLKEHQQSDYLREALAFLREQNLPIPVKTADPVAQPSSGCPGSLSHSFVQPAGTRTGNGDGPPSALTHWPIQLHLLSPLAQHYVGSDLLLAADCVPFALADFHGNYLAGKTLAIACPKLDQNQEIYFEKLKALVEAASVRSITVMIMRVPCCRGLLQLAHEAVSESGRDIPVRCVVVGLQGEILHNDTVAVN